ncbi:MAG TPA: HEAT repeat domain-containing protein [Gemmataceae bacterium]|jgi:HEAT repeat protein|nr:HEAT repeat domain-containing protein [Gemmataceae bacterium]
MRRRPSRKSLLFAVVILIAMALIAIEVFYLSPAVRRWAIEIEKRVGADEALAARLNDEDLDVRGDAGDALVRRGDAAVPTLIKQLDKSEPTARTSAAAILGRIGPPAHSAVPTLKRLMLEDPEITVREQMARSLGQVAFDQPAIIDELIGLLDTGDETTRVMAAEALGAAGEPAARAVPALMRALVHEEAKVRAEAAEALGAMGPAVRPAIPLLFAALDDSDHDVQHSALETLGRLSIDLAKTDPDLAIQINATVNRFQAGQTTPAKR